MRIPIEEQHLYEPCEICDLSRGLYDFQLCNECGNCEEEEEEDYTF